MAYLYLRIKVTEELKSIKMAWVLSYMQGGVAEVQKDNLLDKLLKGESEIETVEELFSKMKNKFRKTIEEEKKIKQLKTIEQGERTYNEYVQEFKKIARESRYKRQSLIEKFKRKLSGEIRRKLVEVESSPCTIEEWQEKLVRLDRNQRQSRAKERILGKNTVCPQRNAQPRGDFWEGLYGSRGRQIM